MPQTPTTSTLWTPFLGAVAHDDGVTFRVWAPTHTAIDVVVERQGAEQCSYRLDRQPAGIFAARVPGVAAGDRYRFRLDGDQAFPDPCSRSQPEGVHGSSAVVDPRAFNWTDQAWPGLPLEKAVIYELHVGTFTPEGTFSAAAAKLEYLAGLGVTVVELMPVAQCPGGRNWGYDGASLFAPAHVYGTPDDLRRLVDAAHQLGLAVILDVVYNHFGPDGAYNFAFSPYYRSERHESPWGAPVNVDDEHSAQVREFFIENAQYWLHEFHLDGFRFDATHRIVDDSPVPLLAEMNQRLRQATPDRALLLVAEDDRNLDTIVRPASEGGWGLDAVWADDFHHFARRLSAGDTDGYYQDFAGSARELAATLTRGWFYCGQTSSYSGRARGTDPAGIPLRRMVICIQNHDQIGNRPFGDRLHHQIDASMYRALSALLLLAPETPLLFMGQEWAASTPFQFFTDHNPELGPLVTAGRRNEFKRFRGFADERIREQIPDPQALSTFEASRLRWAEQDRPGHAGVLRLYAALLQLRRSHPALAAGGNFEADAPGESSLVLRRSAAGASIVVLVWFGQTGTIHPPGLDVGQWRVLLTTDDPRFAGDEPPDTSGVQAGQPIDGVVHFGRPAAVVLERA